MRAGVMILAMLAMTGPAAADTIQLFAAGSLKAALTDVAKAYEAASGNKVEARYGPSGLLKGEISKGTKADVFASANMEHPQALHDERKSGPVSRFARNSLCALVKPGLKVDSASLLERMQTRASSSAPRHRRPTLPATMPSRSSAKPSRSSPAPRPYWKRRPCS